MPTSSAASAAVAAHPVALFARAGVGVAAVRENGGPPRAHTWRQYRTGAANTRLVVNTPATLAGVSLTINAQSNRVVPGFFTPAAAAPARNPSGANIPFSIFFMAPCLPSAGRSFRQDRT